MKKQEKKNEKKRGHAIYQSVSEKINKTVRIPYGYEKSRISGLFRNKYLGVRNHNFLHYSQTQSLDNNIIYRLGTINFYTTQTLSNLPHKLSPVWKV